MKFRSFVIFFLLLGVSSDVYLLLVSAAAMPLWVKAAICLPSLVTLICLPFIGLGVHYTAAVRIFSWVTFLLELPKFISALFSALFRFGVGMVPLTADLWAAGLGGAVSLSFIFLIFYFSRHLIVNNIQLTFPDLPDGLKGLRICQLADLHVGSFGKALRYIRRIVDSTLAQNPDLILFTGDLVNFSTAEVTPFREELARLKARLGVFSVRGNHDYLLHGHHSEAERQKDVDDLLAFEESLGWTVLKNQNVLLRHSDAALAVAGVENISANPFFKDTGGDLSRAVEGIPEGVFTILISHDPSHWRMEVLPHFSVPLTLSGHTHGLHFKFAGFHPSSWRLRESGGIYQEDSRFLHVSKGLGSAFAFRLGSFPRIDMIILNK